MIRNMTVRAGTLVILALLVARETLPATAPPPETQIPRYHCVIVNATGVPVRITMVSPENSAYCSDSKKVLENGETYEDYCYGGLYAKRTVQARDQQKELVTYKWVRITRPSTIRVTSGTGGEKILPGRLIRLGIDSKETEKGLRVCAVTPGSIAAKMGIKPNDLIWSVAALDNDLKELSSKKNPTKSDLRSVLATENMVHLTVDYRRPDPQRPDDWEQDAWISATVKLAYGNEGEPTVVIVNLKTRPGPPK